MNRKNRKWEDWEIRYLEGNYETGSMTVIEMAAHIGRTYGAVLTEAKKLGLKRKRKIYPQQYRNRVKVKPREVQDASYTNICASVLDGDSFEKIARDTNRPVEQVKEYNWACLEPTYEECSVCLAEKYCNYSVLEEENENDR